VRIEVSGSSVADNTVRTVTYRQRFADVCVVPEADAFFFKGDDVRFTSNHISDIGRHLPHAVWLETSETGEPCGLPSGATDWPVPHVDCLQGGRGGSDLVFERNDCHIAHEQGDVGDNSPGHAIRINALGAPVRRASIRNNLFRSQTSMSISVSADDQPVSDLWITSNTLIHSVWDPTQTAVGLNLTSEGPSMEGIVVVDNLFFQPTLALRCEPDCSGELERHHNLIWDPSVGEAGFDAAGDLWSQPIFVDEGSDHRLISGSSGDGDGADLSYLGYGDDLLGVGRGTPWDIGAFETD